MPRQTKKKTDRSELRSVFFREPGVSAVLSLSVVRGEVVICTTFTTAEASALPSS